MRTIPADKANHFILGALAALLGLLAGALWAVALCVLAALGRELYNVWRAGWAWSAWSWPDVAWTLGGGALVLAAGAVGLGGLEVTA